MTRPIFSSRLAEVRNLVCAYNTGAYCWRFLCPGSLFSGVTGFLEVLAVSVKDRRTPETGAEEDGGRQRWVKASPGVPARVTQV